ncbi:MAG: iron-sulfur cluster insertion protein ErpA [Rhodospirillales bacterium]
MPEGTATADEKKISVSDSASRRIKELIAQEGNDALMMRVTVNGGGCSGFTYNFAMDDKTNEDDLIFENAGAKVVVDDTSLDLLKGAELNYIEDLMGSYFAFQNPNAASTCGCGTSFSI